MELKLKLKWKQILVTFSVALLVCACGKSKSNPAPSPVPPPGNSGGIVPINQPSQPLSTYAEFLALYTPATPIQLLDYINYSAIRDLVPDLELDLVGDPQVDFDLNETNGKVTGKIFLGLEDQAGAWGALIKSFGSTGYYSNNILDVIFADDELVVRAVANVSSGDMNGMLYYRVRQSGENQCKPVIVFCNVSVPQQQNPWYWYNQPVFPEECNTNPNVDAPCMAYMNTGVSAVKQLGSFSGSFSEWVK